MPPLPQPAFSLPCAVVPAEPSTVVAETSYDVSPDVLPVRSQPRPALVPAVLLTAAAVAFGGLSLLAPRSSAPVRLTAASASSPMLLADAPSAAAFRKSLDLLDEPATAASREAGRALVTVRKPARASRARRVAPPAPRYVRPGVGEFTSGFGHRWGHLHAGIDLAGPYGSAIRAVTAGTVIEAGRESGYGNVVRIRHADGVVTVYAHLSRILVHGGHVDAGEIIAKEGNTGHSTGPHLHFEVRIGGEPVNPVKWLRKHGIWV